MRLYVFKSAMSEQRYVVDLLEVAHVNEFEQPTPQGMAISREAVVLHTRSGQSFVVAATLDDVLALAWVEPDGTSGRVESIPTAGKLKREGEAKAKGAGSGLVFPRK